MVGLCPFHEEKSGSFSVNDDKGLYYCFGCGAKGTVFDFIGQKKALNFPESVKYVASKLGITIQETSSKGHSRTQQLRKICNTVAGYYQAMLLESPIAQHARDYIEQRGVTSEQSRRWGLGYAPDTSYFCRDKIVPKLSSKFSEFKPKEILSFLIELGLVRPDSEYDFFRDRLLFRICRSDGAVIAFGGRVLKSSSKAPKYLNTKESPIYQKRRAFYGIEQALPVALKRKRMFVVEGYTDVLAMDAANFTNCVATCGTSLTNEHVDVLKRLKGGEVTLVFDGDEAGCKAAERSFDCFINSGLEVSVCLLPAGEDPHSLFRKSTSLLESCLEEQRQGLFEFCLEQKLSKLNQTQVANYFAERAFRITNPVEQELQIGKLANRLGVSKQAILGLRNKKQDSETVVFNKKPSPGTSRITAAVRELYAFRLAQPELFEEVCTNSGTNLQELLGSWSPDVEEDDSYIESLVERFSKLSKKESELFLTEAMDNINNRMVKRQLTESATKVNADLLQEKLRKIRALAGVKDS